MKGKVRRGDVGLGLVLKEAKTGGVVTKCRLRLIVTAGAEAVGTGGHSRPQKEEGNKKKSLPSFIAVAVAVMFYPRSESRGPCACQEELEVTSWGLLRYGR